MREILIGTGMLLYFTGLFLYYRYNIHLPLKVLEEKYKKKSREIK